MEKLLNEYNYSRQFIFLEDATKKFYTSLDSENDGGQIDDYLWKVVTSVSQKEVEGRKFHMIQHEDKRVGWIELTDSLQIFRHPAEQYKIFEDNFSNNELNRKMGIDKDFISHFKDRLLNVKSEVRFDGERYLSVFIKNKFHGFHHEDVMDPIIKCNIDLTEYGTDFELYNQSNLTKPAEDVTVNEMKIIAVFKKNEIGKVLVNNEEYYWFSFSAASKPLLEKIAEVTMPCDKSREKLELDDLIYSIYQEREKTKDIMKSVLSAKNYLKDGKSSGVLLEDNDSYLEIESKYNELKRKYDTTTLEYERKLRKNTKDLELSNKRLEHQKDYNDRVTEQRDKYKSRMVLIEDKLKNLDEKYKVLKEKYKQKNSKNAIGRFKSAFKGDDK